jgi:DNA-directed RNA polymerase specialized sigma24 family protein
VTQGVKLSRAEIEAILALLAEGYTYAEVAEATGFGAGTVCRTVKRHGHPPPPCWTEETVAAPLERLYRSAVSYEEMARRLGISLAQVKRWLRRRGLTGRPRRVTDEDVAEMVRLRNEGLFYREIAARLGWHHDTVYWRVREAAGVDHGRAAERKREVNRRWAYRDVGQYRTHV